jgi:hypothetical protein
LLRFARNDFQIKQGGKKMKHTRIFVSLLLLMLLFSLACSSLTGIGSRANEVKETAGAVVTDALELATEGAPLVETVQSIATDIPELKVTAEALITENPAMVETVQAIATEGLDMGEAPGDIPVVDEATITNFYGSDAFVSYTTNQGFQAVTDFYKTEMPANGWEADPDLTFEITNTATLTWNQVDRQAIVIITFNPLDSTVFVAITIRGR